MRSGILFLTAIASSVLVGCGSPGLKPSYFQNRPVYVEDTPPVLCPTQDCSLVVTVNDCAGGDIKVTDPLMTAGPNLNMKSGPTQLSRKITWKIVTAGYEFADDSFKYGILIKSDPDDEFKNAQVTGSGKDTLTIQYTKNATGSQGQYTYGLQLRSSSGNKPYCALLDPWLIS
jgi:hypothetical protein